MTDVWNVKKSVPLFLKKTTFHPLFFGSSSSTGFVKCSTLEQTVSLFAQQLSRRSQVDGAVTRTDNQNNIKNEIS